VKGANLNDALDENARLRSEVERLRTALDEREADMHVRIRGKYDKTIADAWRAKVAEVEAQRDAARAVIRRLVGAMNRWGAEGDGVPDASCYADPHYGTAYDDAVAMLESIETGKE
jgi:hypothetical protein